MGIKRYTAEADTTITNAYKISRLSRATTSNMGLADSLEVFHLSGNVINQHELSRILIKFPVDTIISDRASSKIPASGSVSFYLKMYNAEHPYTLPRNYTLVINPVTKTWEEGIGIDADTYMDVDAANWLSSSTEILWDLDGGDYSETPNYSASFDVGYENLEINITPLVEQWIAGTLDNHGIMIKLPSETESGSTSQYTKKFYARGSEYFFKRPIIESRFDDTRTDMRSNFFNSSSQYSASDNLNTVYFYNRNRQGTLTDLAFDNVYVKLYNSSSNGVELVPSPIYPITATHVSEGIYSAQFALDTTESCFYDVWYSGSTEIYTGTINVFEYIENQKYIISMPHLQKRYSNSEEVRFDVFTRRKNWYPNLYLKVVNNVKPDIIENLYYKVVRESDDFVVIDYDTGSSSTKLSYDISGSYFTFDTSMLEADYMYYFKFMYVIDDDVREFNKKFKFRIEEV